MKAMIVFPVFVFVVLTLVAHAELARVEVHVTKISELYEERLGEFCTIVGTTEDGTLVMAQVEARRCVLMEPNSVWMIRKRAVMR